MKYHHSFFGNFWLLALIFFNLANITRLLYLNLHFFFVSSEYYEILNYFLLFLIYWLIIKLICRFFLLVSKKLFDIILRTAWMVNKNIKKVLYNLIFTGIYWENEIYIYGISVIFSLVFNLLYFFKCLYISLGYFLTKSSLFIKKYFILSSMRMVPMH